MALNATARRRWFGALVLALAMVMLVAGETALADRLGPAPFLCYWLVCLVLTCSAIVVAFQDVRALQQRSRQEQRALLESTLKEIQTEAKTKPRRDSE